MKTAVLWTGIRATRLAWREGAQMSEQVREAIVDALREVADPCCRERGISVIDMGLLHDVRVVGDGDVTVDVLLTSGWCPFQVDLVAEITNAVEELDVIDRAEVRITLDEAWSTQRLSDEARRKLRFLPEPNAVADRDAYLAAHRPPTTPGAQP